VALSSTVFSRCLNVYILCGIHVQVHLVQSLVYRFLLFNHDTGPQLVFYGVYIITNAPLSGDHHAQWRDIRRGQ